MQAKDIMLPRQHIIYGFIFSVLFYFIFHIPIIYAISMFLASFLIDFDHYMTACMSEKRLLNYKEAFDFQIRQGIRLIKLAKKGIREYETFHVFHTVEFQILIFILGVFVSPLFYFILMGMLFHIALDIYQMRKLGVLHTREFLLINYLRRS